MVTRSNGQTICNINTRCELEYLITDETYQALLKWQVPTL